MKTSIARRLAAVMTTAACLFLSAASGEAAGQGRSALSVAKSDKAVSVFDGDRVLAEYLYTGVPYKPYVSRWFSPGGVQVLRDSPADHKHHHALMFAVVVDGVDFWGEFPNKPQGRQVQRSVEPIRAAEVVPLPGARGELTSVGWKGQLDWLAADGKALLAEDRTVMLYRGLAPEASLLVWRTRLAPAEGKSQATLTGTHYDGLGMRFIESMDKGGQMFNAEGREGEIVRDDNHVIRSRWCAYTALADGKPATVALFDHPGNPRHPALMFYMTRPFAYLSVTLNVWKEPLVIEAGRPLELQYAAVLWDGRQGRSEVEAFYRQWLALTAPAVPIPHAPLSTTPSPETDN